MAVNRSVPATPSVGDAIRNLGGEAPPESQLAPESAAIAPLAPHEPVPLATVESNTGMRSGGWDSAADDIEPRLASGSDELEATETVFVPVAPPRPVSPSSHIAFAPATTTPDAVSHRVSDAEPVPYMPATGGGHRVSTQSVAASLAAMGLETPVEPEYDAPVNPGDFQFAAGPVDPAPVEPAPTDEATSVPELAAPLPPAAPESTFVPPFPLAPTPLPSAMAPPPAPAPIAPAVVAPEPESEPALSGPVAAPPVFARPENIAPESAEPEFLEPEAPAYTAPVPSEPAHVMPPLGPEGVYSVAPPVASVLPGAPKPAVVVPEAAFGHETPEAEYADGPDPTAVLETSGYEYQPEAYEAEDPREALRSATRRAVDRLTQPVGAPTSTPAPEPARVVVPESHLPRIVELTMQVERAVIGAAAAERFQREIEQTAREAAADVISTAATEAQRTLDRATAESQSLIAGARAEADKLLSDAQAERGAIIARAESQARATVAQAEIELDRRLRRIAALTDEIVDIAESAAERTGAGAMSGPQIAQFIGALGTVTDRALEQIEQANQSTSNTTPKVTDGASVSAEAEIES